MTCPMCGSSNGIAAEWQEHKMRNYAFGSTIVPPPGTVYTRQEPVGSATLEGQVKVPFFQSAISGIFATIAFGAGAAIAGTTQPAIVGLAAGGATSGLVWLFTVRSHNALLWKFEEFVGRDINQDGNIGEPDNGQNWTDIDEVDERYPNGTPKLWRLSWLPISPEETQRLAIAIAVKGVSFDRDSLVNAKALKFNSYSGVMKVLLDRNYLRRKGRSKSSGVGVTFAGYRWFCKQLPEGTIPLPYSSLPSRL